MKQWFQKWVVRVNKSNLFWYLILKVLLLLITFYPMKVLLIEDYVDKIIVQITIYTIYIIFNIFLCVKYNRIVMYLIKIIDFLFVIIGSGLFLKYSLIAVKNIPGEGAFVYLFYILIAPIILFGVVSLYINKEIVQMTLNQKKPTPAHNL